MRKILIVTGDGGESYETWFAVQRFQEAGYETRVAAPSKRRLHLVMHDLAGLGHLQGSSRLRHGIRPDL